MREISLVRLQLLILGKCTRGGEMCKLSASDRRASAAVQASSPYIRTCFVFVLLVFSKDVELVSALDSCMCPCSLFSLRMSGVGLLCVARKG